MKTTIIKNIIFALLLAVSSLSCKRAEIEYATGSYYLFTNPVIEDTLSTKEPKIYAACAYDPVTGRLMHKTYVMPDRHPSDLPGGGYINIVEGDWDFIVYAYDNNIVIEKEDVLEGAYATTKTLSYMDDVPIYVMPDKFYMYRERMYVPYVTDQDGTYVIECRPVPVTEKWTVIIDGIKNQEYLSNMGFYISGQSAGRYLMGEGNLLKSESIIFFGGAKRMGYASEEGKEPLVMATFNTFGRLQRSTGYMLTIAIKGVDGLVYKIDYDVSEQITNPENTGKIIYITTDVTLEKTGDKGFDPHAAEWIDIVDKVELN